MKQYITRAQFFELDKKERDELMSWSLSNSDVSMSRGGKQLASYPMLTVFGMIGFLVSKGWLACILCDKEDAVDVFWNEVKKILES